jgi:hypothetical protein
MKPQIPPTEMQARAEYKFNSFFIIAPRGLGVRDLLGAEVWQEIAAHEANINAKLIKPFDLVRARAEDGAFDVQLTVVARRKDGTPILQFWPRGQTEQPATALAPPSPAKSRAEALGVLGYMQARATSSLPRRPAPCGSPGTQTRSSTSSSTAEH